MCQKQYGEVRSCAKHVFNELINNNGVCNNWCGSRDISRILDGKLYCRGCFESIFFNSPHLKERYRRRLKRSRQQTK